MMFGIFSSQISLQLMEYDNETVPEVIGAAVGDASPAVLYGPRFTLLNIHQVLIARRNNGSGYTMRTSSAFESDLQKFYV